MQKAQYMLLLNKHLLHIQTRVEIEQTIIKKKVSNYVYIQRKFSWDTNSM